MLKTLSPVLLAVALGPWLQIIPAHAQSAQTFVSGRGKDGRSCTVSSPCRTLQAALARTNAGGEIYVLDSANYGSATITKAVTIVAEDGVAGVLAQSNVNGITINAGANDVVTLRGLDIDGAGSGANGIVFTTGGTLSVQNCTIRGFANSGISFQPTGPSSLFVTDTTVSDNAGTAIQFHNGAASPSIAVLKDVQLINNDTGMAAQGSASAGPAKVTVQNGVVANNRGAGIVAADFSVVNVADTTVVNNAIGLSAQGTGAAVNAFQSTVTANATGMQAANGGKVVSSANNALGGNTSGNTVPSAAPPPPPPPPPPPAFFYAVGPNPISVTATAGDPASVVPPSVTYEMNAETFQGSRVLSPGVHWSVGIQPWMTATPASGVTPGQTTVSFAGASALPPGTYNTTITLKNDDSGSGTFDVLITLTVVAPPSPLANYVLDGGGGYVLDANGAKLVAL